MEEPKGKLVEREVLSYFENELWQLMLNSPSNLHDRVENLYKYYCENILQEEKERKNELKRILMRKIKTSSDPKEKDYLYDWYKSLDKPTDE